VRRSCGVARWSVSCSPLPSLFPPVLGCAYVRRLMPAVIHQMTERQAAAAATLLALTEELEQTRLANAQLTSAEAQARARLEFASNRIHVMAALLAPSLQSASKSVAQQLERLATAVAAVGSPYEGYVSATPLGSARGSSAVEWEIALPSTTVHELARLLLWVPTTEFEAEASSTGSSRSRQARAVMKGVEELLAHVASSAGVIATRFLHRDPAHAMLAAAKSARLAFASRTGGAGASASISDNNDAYWPSELAAVSDLRVQVEALQQELDARGSEVDALLLRCSAAAGEMRTALAESVS